MQWRIGLGIDAHRFVPERPLILGGVNIPHELGLIGYSDGDVVFHAVCDALFGAIGAGDIGHHFPDTDPRYKGRSSSFFVQEAIKLVKEFGWQIGNCDITVIAQKPKLAPYRQAIREKTAEILGVEKDCVSVKATTTDQMGFTGRGEGIAALVVVSLRRN